MAQKALTEIQEFFDNFIFRNSHLENDTRLRLDSDLNELNLLNIENATANIALGVFICDTDKMIRFVNKANEEIVGFPAEDVIGHTVDYMMEYRGLQNICVDHVLETEQYYSSIVTSPITNRQFLSSGAPIYDIHGKLCGVIVIDQDYHVMQSMADRLNELEVKNIFYKTLYDQSSYIIDQLNRQSIVLKNRFTDTDDYRLYTSPAIIQTYHLADQAAKTDVTTLLTGETGVGKEVFANYIFEHSNRRKKPLIKVNCAAIPENLLESELFGYVRGAFTGASNKGKTGMFELANNGTILLDEIGDLPFDFQAKLLRVLQQKEISKIGDTKVTKLDVRIIASTNQNLADMVEKGTFRQDLYYRLNIFPIHIPALRERREDIPILTKHFLSVFNHQYKKHLELSDQALSKMCDYGWPGNIRELENMMERWAVIFEDNTVIQWDRIRKYFTFAASEFSEISQYEGRTLKELMTAHEKNILTWAFQTWPSTRSIAKALGVDHSTIVRKAKQYGLSSRS
ncbi:MAG: sigma 54-interacting transcriptional regulator [Clostridiales bacterium]|nr:sigma 54-interacting transcriptional regulator [Clostridiales bacterium]